MGAGMPTQGGTAVHCSGYHEEAGRKMSSAIPTYTFNLQQTSPLPAITEDEERQLEQYTTPEAIYSESCLYLEFSISLFLDCG